MPIICHELLVFKTMVKFLGYEAWHHIPLARTFIPIKKFHVKSHTSKQMFNRIPRTTTLCSQNSAPLHIWMDL